MDPQLQSRYQARAKVIKALAHPTRLFIVDQIADQEKCVCELKEMIGADMSTVSKHLSVLKDAGVVSDEKRGLMVFYRLRVPCILNLFGCIEGVLKANAEAQLAAMK
ncbi:MAG: helix-turn-helix transcriptional regulator [Candidatus Hydrogenedentes bacterium]|nr:helix-turn-helix transcriptional regulator [Candidatus Hydrogenedentota bacterium]